MLATKEAKIRSCTGEELHCTYWYPEDDKTPRALVFVCHGFGEYLVTYDRVVACLLKAGMLAFGHDHVGFGRSGGKRAHIESIDQYCKDVECHVSTIKEKMPNIPMFIVGHSMGGAVAVNTAILYPQLFEGLVLLSPGLAVAKKFNNKTMRFLGKTLARVAPGAGLVQLEASAITSDASIIEKYSLDPLIYKGKVKAGWLNAYRQAIDHINRKISLLKTPFLCLQAAKDPWIPATDIERICNKASSTDKTVVIIPDALHRVFDEPNGIGDDVCARATKWIVERLDDEEVDD